MSPLGIQSRAMATGLLLLALQCLCAAVFLAHESYAQKTPSAAVTVHVVFGALALLIGVAAVALWLNPLE